MSMLFDFDYIEQNGEYCKRYSNRLMSLTAVLLAKVLWILTNVIWLAIIRTV